MSKEFIDEMLQQLEKARRERERRLAQQLSEQARKMRFKEMLAKGL